MEISYPELIRVSVIGETHEEREIILITLSINVAEADNKPALLYTGTIHAREWIGNELAIKFVEYITENYQFDPRLERTLQSSTIYIVPSLNPDGFEYSRKHFSFWRKNRRKNSDGTYGVDLNRNFSIGFEKVSDKSSNIYGGEFPFSEPETKAIKDFVDSHSNITIALDYHSQGNVFFPAHKFKHEAEIDGTDINTLCANMSHEIQKVSGRTYGIHRGKPPSKLISGSGREYYYSKGIISAVVEVGTKNIPDYAKSMTESINEHIPALVKALSEVINYSPLAPKRVDNFTIESVDIQEITLQWDYELRDDIYFEIYRNELDKQASGDHNRVGVTKSHSFTDVQLKSGSQYFYTIRAVNQKTKIKSPFAPVVKVTTLLDRCEFSKKIFPIKSETGYLAEKTLETNRGHFGKNSLFVGVNKFKGISDGVLSFSLDSLPEDAVIEEATLHLYPMNRVGAKIEKYGEWNISILDDSAIADIYDFKDVENAPIIGHVGEALKSQNLTQGIWNHWKFSKFEAQLLQTQLKSGKVRFRVDGPKELPLGEDSQMMQFDIGYGTFGGGLEYRPLIDIKYKLPSDLMSFEPQKALTVSSQNSVENSIKVGFDSSGDKIYGAIEFSIDELPQPKTTLITEAYIEIESGGRLKGKEDIRFYLELVDMDSVDDYNSIKSRQKIDFIGYEVSSLDIVEGESRFFIFDSNLKLKLEDMHSQNRNIRVVIRATSPSETKSKELQWINPKLHIRYIKKRKESLPPVSNLKTSVEKGMIKLSWDNPKDESFKGCYVIRNSFHPPKNFSDGVKLYGGSDSYTYDNFASLDKSKFYAVFTYDDVPNFSEPQIVHYIGD
jgi:predicted deacylase